MACPCHDPSVWGHTECPESLWFGLDDQDRYRRVERDGKQRDRWDKRAWREMQVAESKAISQRFSEGFVETAL